jgi:N-acetylated-alpha-linked acidic dipeptidase
MAIGAWRDPAFEQLLWASISEEVPWAVVTRFSTLVRETGTAQEREAVAYLIDRLSQWQVPHTLHEPVCLVSLPRGAALRVLGRRPQDVVAKTPSFSAATGDAWLEGQVAYVPTGFAADITQIFGPGAGVPAEVRGRIALTEGYPMPGKVLDFMRAGAVGAVFISPGERIHEGICTSIWGSPDLDSVERKPTIPVVAVSRPDGERLKALVASRRRPPRLAMQTRLEERWRPIPVLVAEIAGQDVPEEFCLVHGHVDSWHVGVGDNATGDATLLELARVFWVHRHRLRRTLRVAWWSGHSHGRYAGSTWYADTFGLDLAEWCVAQVNCDSPGCRDASAFEHVMWMSEAEELARASVEDAAGLPASGARPLRAGDYSFNNIGLTGFYMLLSEIPEAEKARRGLYAVGGCGGNIEWHAEDDTLPVADRANLVRDIKVYATGVSRALNAPLHPFDFRKTADEILATLKRYEAGAGGRLDLSEAAREAEGLRGDLADFYEAAEVLAERPPSDPDVRRFNRRQRALARVLVRINYTRQGPFRHDPAVEVPALPDLAEAPRLGGAPEGSPESYVLSTHLARGRNRVTWALKEARQIARGGL